nr:hypothetical protein [uncultured Undibacterium sp.]
MRSLHPFQIACLFGLLSLLSACDKKTEIQDKKMLPQAALSRSAEIDFNFPIELEFKLVTKDVIKAAQLCKIEGLNAYECKITVSGKSDAIEHGEVNAKANAVFSRKQLDNLLSSMKEKFQTEGKLSYSIGQKKKFEFSPQ